MWIKTFLLYCFIFAANANADTIGDIAKGLGHGVDFISEGLHFIVLVTGSLMVLGSFFKYMKYRKNPVEVKFSSVFVMFVAGLALVLLYFLPEFYH